MNYQINTLMNVIRIDFLLESMSEYSQGKVRATGDIIDGINEIIDNNELRNDL